jgi:hypothetical protein
VRISLPAAASLVSIASALAVAPARADDLGAAQALFNEAKALMEAGKYDAACPKLAESQKMAPAIGTRYNLADCQEHVGQTASAWANFLGVAAAAKSAGQASREAAARDRAAKLEPRLSRMAVVVPPAARAPGLEVKRDDETIGAAQWGEALPVDPGAHAVVARAPGKRTYEADVEVVGDASTARVAIPALDDAVTVAAPPPPPPPPAECPKVAAAPAVAAPEPATTKPLGWGLVIGGGVAVVGGVVFWLLRDDKVSTLDGECVANLCPASATGDIATGKMYSGISVSLFGVGAVAALAGAGVLLLGDRRDASRPSATLVPVSVGDARGVGVAGRF